jgi:hypothetical protein
MLWQDNKHTIIKTHNLWLTENLLRRMLYENISQSSQYTLKGSLTRDFQVLFFYKSVFPMALNTLFEFLRM